MFRKLKEEDGSGIIWAMAVAGFLLILVGAVLSISLAYQNRSRRNDDARQAYLTARSAADMVAQEFIAGSPTAAEIFAYLLEEAWTVEDVGFAADMGRCSLHAVLEPYDGNTTRREITVTATAVKGRETQSVTASLVGVLQRQGEESTPGGMDSETGRPEEKTLTWYLAAYSGDTLEGVASE